MTSRKMRFKLMTIAISQFAAEFILMELRNADSEVASGNMLADAPRGTEWTFDVQELNNGKLTLVY